MELLRCGSVNLWYWGTGLVGSYQLGTKYVTHLYKFSYTNIRLKMMHLTLGWVAQPFAQRVAIKIYVMFIYLPLPPSLSLSRSHSLSRSVSVCVRLL